MVAEVFTNGGKPYLDDIFWDGCQVLSYLQFLENDGAIMTNVQTDAFIYMLLSTTVPYGKDVGSDQSQVKEASTYYLTL